MIYIVTAICEENGCEDNGTPNIFENENVESLVVFCGKCKKEISNITVIEK